MNASGSFIRKHCPLSPFSAYIAPFLFLPLTVHVFLFSAYHLSHSFPVFSFLLSYFFSFLCIEVFPSTHSSFPSKLAFSCFTFSDFPFFLCFFSFPLYPKFINLFCLFYSSLFSFSSFQLFV